jgi:hypothetical protein
LRNEIDFAEIFKLVKAKGVPYGSGPFSYTDGKINERRGGRGFCFEDPNGQLLSERAFTGSDDRPEIGIKHRVGE